MAASFDPVLSFRNLPVGRKVAVLIAGAGVLVLLTAGLAIGIYDVYRMRAASIREYANHARILAANVSAALRVADRTVAAEFLDALRLEPHMLCARLLRADGAVLARFDRSAGIASAAAVPSGPVVFSGQRLLVSEPVAIAGEANGTLVLEVDFAAVRSELLWPRLVPLGLILVVSLLLAVLLVHLFRGSVVRPLERLAGIAHRVAGESGSTAQRGEAVRDEVGQVTSVLDTLLVRVGEVQRELQLANVRLAAEIAERTRLQNTVLEADRRVGMAEVATGVLHNVGNVLNGINVSALLLRERLGEARFESLVRFADTLRQHEADLARYLADDPRGRQAVAYIERLASHFAEVRTTLRTEIDAICAHVAHVKEIVAVQQNYARPGGLVESMAPSALMDDAVQMNNDLIATHRIRVERHYEPTPMLAVDKHRVIQILVNLVSNAAHAVKANPPADRIVAVGVDSPDAARVCFVVTDNGAGVAPEDRVRLFSRGFTTRSDGHGFGLHSGFLAAKELGGSIVLASDGPGKGATFTLELPSAPRNPDNA